MNILIIGGCGYVGSSLVQHLSSFPEHTIQTVDLEWFGNVNSKNNLNYDYINIEPDFLAKHNCVILLAGHSSVKMCDSKLSSYNNNVRNFINLVHNLTPNQKFIYASSSSVYGNTPETSISEDNLDFSPVNYYDMTKLHIDHIAQLSGLDYYGLRFGTVNGPAPHTRMDVMINAMVNTAKTKGEIHVFNPDTKRSILGINDLCRAVSAIINEPTPNPGIYNLASFTSTSGEIATAVGEVAQVPVVNKDTPAVITNEKLEKKTYNFGVSTLKFEKTYNFKFNDTVTSITESMLENYNGCVGTHRSTPMPYN